VAIANPGQSLLDAGLAAGIAMPFSCAMGGCGACKVRLVEGQLEMDEPNCLTGPERAEGYVLTCVGHPMSRVVVELPGAMS
jgi:ferredoxin